MSDETWTDLRIEYVVAVNIPPHYPHHGFKEAAYNCALSYADGVGVDVPPMCWTYLEAGRSNVECTTSSRILATRIRARWEKLADKAWKEQETHDDRP